MRYKAAVTTKLENLSNSLITLNHMIQQGTTREQVEAWFTNVKEKIEDIKTLVNSENEQAEGSW
jgi:ribosomal silencing factor RsfS